MRRRTLLLASGAWAALAAGHGWAQTPGAPRRIAWLSASSLDTQATHLQAFRAKLKELRQIEGRDFVIDLRWAEGRPERLPALARELIALKPAVIVTAGSAALGVLQKETRTIPVVFGTAADPVEQGFIRSLARPGGNVTGVTLRLELTTKLVEIVREALPAARRIALLEHETDPFAKRAAETFQQAASRLDYAMRVIRVKRPEDLAQAFVQALQEKAEVVLAPPASFFSMHAQSVGELALKSRLALAGGFRNHATSGGLLSYYSDIPENWRRAAVLTDKILRGANPGELSVEQPDRFFLVINLRSAKLLGVSIPQSILLRADEVIE